MPAIDPTLAVGGSEWSIGAIGGGLGTEGATAPAGGAEGSASRDLASGTATDPAATVMTIERARLSMQLAAQIRTKGVEALQEIFHTSV